MRTFDWNQGESHQPPPAVCDSTLAEADRCPELAKPTLEESTRWIEALYAMGVERFEVPANKELLLELRTRLAPTIRLMVSSDEQGALGESILQEPPTDIEYRWCPDCQRSPGSGDFEVARRLKGLGLTVTLCVADTVQRDPITLSRWIHEARRHGIDHLELNARNGAPWCAGISSLIDFVVGLGQPRESLVWSSDHGFGMALAQALEAWRLGARCLRASFLGLGPRGNLPIELLLVNLDLEGAWKHPLISLSEVCAWGRKVWDLDIPHDYPVFGKDAFRTASGIHASAIVKALSKGQSDLADRVYSGVPAARFGREQIIEVGPLSGKCNIQHWLGRHQLPSETPRLDAMLADVKQSQTIFSDIELYDLYCSTAPALVGRNSS